MIVALSFIALFLPWIVEAAAKRYYRRKHSVRIAVSHGMIMGQEFVFKPPITDIAKWIWYARLSSEKKGKTTFTIIDQHRDVHLCIERTVIYSEEDYAYAIRGRGRTKKEEVRVRTVVERDRR